MLRLAFMVLLLANAGYYAWMQGWLQGGPGHRQRVRAAAPGAADSSETLKVLRARRANNPTPPPAPAAAPAADTTASAPAPTAAAPADAGECLQAGVFDDKQAAALRTAAAALPPGSWSLEPTPIAGRRR